jgi:hypothetical protein
VTYAPNFNDDSIRLQYVDDTYKDSVIENFGINRRDPLSPVDTILFDSVDVIALAGKLMDIYSSPQQIIKCESRRLLGRNLFDIIGIDVGRHDDEHLYYGEVLEIAPDYLGKIEKVTIRKIDNPVINTVPDALILRAAIPSLSGGVTLVFDESLEGSVTGYNLYWTSNPANWTENSEVYTIKTFTPEFKLYHDITGLLPGLVYYFRVSCYNVYGESELSNFKAIMPAAINAYRCAGSIAAGAAIDELNTLSGSRLASWSSYDGTHLYDGNTYYQPACLFDSGNMFAYPYFKKLSIFGETDAGFILYQIRYSDDGATWTAWSVAASCIGLIEITIANRRYVNYRIIYEPNVWSDSDNFRVTEIN